MDFIYDEGTFKKITKEIADSDEILEGLEGYKFKYETDGYHKNDGQMVEYTFTFVSPSKKKTEFSTEMCLMCGWNYHQNLTIK